MPVMQMQLNTPLEITRDLQVEVIDQITNRTVQTTPNLDGTINVRNLTAGQYRVRVQHPNLTFPVLDQPVRVFPTRPTFVPIKIDLDIFENTPVRDIAEADLGPVQASLSQAVDDAGRQNTKQGGEPIYADDWNALADVVGDVADATLDLTRRVSATGHDHVELIEKMDEIQRNLQRFLDVFGRSMAQVQRQLQALALEQRTNRALDRIPDLTAARRGEVLGLVRGLDDVRTDNPYTYMARSKRVGENLEVAMAELLVDTDPEVGNDADVVELLTTVRGMSATKPASSYEEEVSQHLKLDEGATGGNFTQLLGGGLPGGVR